MLSNDATKKFHTEDTGRLNQNFKLKDEPCLIFNYVISTDNIIFLISLVFIFTTDNTDNTDGVSKVCI